MKHLAVIMDGNGRWAEQRGLLRSVGHEKGANAFVEAIRDFVSLPLEVMTFYAFSTENNNRNEEEVSNILNVIAYFLQSKVFDFARENNIEVVFIGDLEKLPDDLQKTIYSFPRIVNPKKTLVIAVNYGGVNEVVRAVNKLIMLNAPVTEKSLLNALDTGKIVPPEAVLRYGCYRRLSNFLPLQTVYSELFFIDKLWPDYSKEDIIKVMQEFDSIKRNFGEVKKC